MQEVRCREGERERERINFYEYRQEYTHVSCPSRSCKTVLFSRVYGSFSSNALSSSYVLHVQIKIGKSDWQESCWSDYLACHVILLIVFDSLKVTIVLVEDHTFSRIVLADVGLLSDFVSTVAVYLPM